jgi:hypothetical protein
MKTSKVSQVLTTIGFSSDGEDTYIYSSLHCLHSPIHGIMFFRLSFDAKIKPCFLSIDSKLISDGRNPVELIPDPCNRSFRVNFDKGYISTSTRLQKAIIEWLIQTSVEMLTRVTYKG